MSKRIRRKFPDEFKDEAIKLITEQFYSIAEAAKNLDRLFDELSGVGKKCHFKRSSLRKSRHKPKKRAELTTVQNV